MFKNILIIQTAFLGDLILTLPLVQVLKKSFPDSQIDFLCIPKTSEILKNNSYLNEVIIYDKKNSGIKEFINLIKRLRNKSYDLLISPHRSFRSSLIAFFSSARKTVSFDKSSLNFLYSVSVPYFGNIHEIQRNLKLLEPAGIIENGIIRPELFPGKKEIERLNRLFLENNILFEEKIISIAPGSVWFTKKFPKEKFVKLCDLLSATAVKIFLIGSTEDSCISEFILKNSHNKNLINTTGELSIQESTELIKRSFLLITNDSAPLHIANSVGTDVIAIFGATIPEFGFYPYGKKDIIFETNGLMCRPCSIHGGDKCPIETFVCMNNIKEENILEQVKRMLS
ncbi:MAG: glycosyltransferase family 9 protein [Bacteroidota bacterium]|nr:glycosyltransferase family 9 protein [Bacteroidota bacterium]